MSELRNITEERAKLIEKYGEEGATDILKQDAKKLMATIDKLGDEIQKAYDKYALASAAASCGTVVITWLGDDVLSQMVAGQKKAIRLIAKIAKNSIEELLD